MQQYTTQKLQQDLMVAQLIQSSNLNPLLLQALCNQHHHNLPSPTAPQQQQTPLTPFVGKDQASLFVFPSPNQTQTQPQPLVPNYNHPGDSQAMQNFLLNANPNGQMSPVNVSQLMQHQTALNMGAALASESQLSNLNSGGPFASNSAASLGVSLPMDARALDTSATGSQESREMAVAQQQSLNMEDSAMSAPFGQSSSLFGCVPMEQGIGTHSGPFQFNIDTTSSPE